MMNETPIYKFIRFISLDCVKVLGKAKVTKSLVRKDDFCQNLCIFREKVKNHA